MFLSFIYQCDILLPNLAHANAVLFMKSLLKRRKSIKRCKNHPGADWKLGYRKCNDGFRLGEICEKEPDIEIDDTISQR